jgi:crotonobetainyl-CoA:carnitine CoA-transferase CaiB-like acyl-CoA transferase
VHGAQRHLTDFIALYDRTGIVAQRWGNWEPLLCVHGILKCGKSSYPNSKNPQEQEVGFCFVSAFKDDDFKKLCAVTGNAELAKKYPTHADRVEADAQMAIYPALEKWASDKTKEEVWKAFTDAGLVSQPVWNSNEAANQEHWHLRGSMQWIDDPTFGDVQTQGVPYRLSETPGRINWVLKPVGADNEYLLSKLCGFTGGQIAELEKKEII